jgi:hypothetical protein
VAGSAFFFDGHGDLCNGVGDYVEGVLRGRVSGGGEGGEGQETNHVDEYNW